MWNFLSLLTILIYNGVFVAFFWISVIGLVIFGAITVLMVASLYFLIFKPLQWIYYAGKRHCHWLKYNRSNK